MDLNLATYSTFKIGGIAHKVCEINEKSDIEKINSYSLSVDKPLLIIGEGSNSIFGETSDKYIIGLMKLKGITTQTESHQNMLVTIQGGEMWDELVSLTVENNLSGIEALSGIPGTVGAAPVQNIGAYGSELADVFVEAEVFDRKECVFKIFSKEDCLFSYRESIFKQRPERYIILNITIKLHTTPPSIPQYKVVQEYFKNSTPTLLEIRNAITAIRNEKIPDYKIFPNCGSFFKNPIIDKTQLEKLITQYPNIPYFETTDSRIKLYAGWLIEHVDYVSTQNERVHFNEKNKLILINTGNATFEDLENVITRITTLVKESFGITLEPEPNIFI